MRCIVHVLSNTYTKVTNLQSFNHTQFLRRFSYFHKVKHRNNFFASSIAMN